MWQLKPAQAADMPGIEELIAEVDGDRVDLVADQFVVAKDEDGKILGCGRLRPYPEFCEIASLAVAPDGRSKGLGREIVNSLLSRFQGPIYLICEYNVVEFFRRFDFALLPESAMPAGLRPKWDYFSAVEGTMNLMRRG